MKVGRWSTNAGGNTTATPDGWPEGQAASTLNDCAREMMAALRTVFNDSQYFDQDYTPTFSTVTTFTVPGDQTSAVHAGRRLKLYDASTMYATVTTASYTAVTTIQVVTDSGSNLTNSLSSFAIGIISARNSAFPDGLSLSLAGLNVSGRLSVGGSLNISGVLSASTVVATNIPKAWVAFSGSAAGATIRSSHNVNSVSRSATGVYRVNFTNAFADTNYIWTYGSGGNMIIGDASVISTSVFKFKSVFAPDGTDSDGYNQLVFFR